MKTSKVLLQWENVYNCRTCILVLQYYLKYFNNSTILLFGIKYFFCTYQGGLSIAVPGNVKGLHHVWKKHGRLPWGELIEPTIKFAKDGFVISNATGKSIAGATKGGMKAGLM